MRRVATGIGMVGCLFALFATEPVWFSSSFASDCDEACGADDGACSLPTTSTCNGCFNCSSDSGERTYTGALHRPIVTGTGEANFTTITCYYLKPCIASNFVENSECKSLFGYEWCGPEMGKWCEECSLGSATGVPASTCYMVACGEN